MAITGDGPGSKLALIFLVVVLFYLSFFGFDLGRAYEFAVSADASLFQALGF